MNEPIGKVGDNSGDNAGSRDTSSTPAKSTTSPYPPPKRLEYTCPMHPQVVGDGPGDCPICGMALEPVVATGRQVADAELVGMTRRFWVCLVFTALLMALAMWEMSQAQNVVATGKLGIDQRWLELALATPVVLWGGWPIFVRFARSLVTRLNMWTLIGLGTAVAYLYSVVATVAPQIFPPAFRHSEGHVEVYYEAAAAIITLVLLGQVLEGRARSRTGGAIRALLGLAPNVARRIEADGSEHELPIGEIQMGDRLRVRPGDKLAVDGVLLEGSGSVDESMITGEPMPVAKKLGDALIAGTVNIGGMFIMQARQVGSKTLLAQIVRMVAAAQRSRAPIQSVADAVSSWFVPAVVAAAVIAFVVWSLLGPPPAMAYALLAAVTVLIIACPCALGLATPMSIMVGTGRGAQAGVLIRNAEALETLGKADVLVVDKTGTLTEGRPAVVTVEALEPFNERELLTLAGSLERGSEHPLAAAIVRIAQQRGAILTEPVEFQAVAGRGVVGMVQGRRVAVGTYTFMQEQGAQSMALVRRVHELREQGQTVAMVAIDGQAAGLLGVADPMKPTTQAAIGALQAQGLHVVMLTGDHLATAQAVAAQLGIDDIHAEVMPQQKHAVIKHLQAQGHIVAMAGDGINDAPALAQAHVGIAMGTGTDVAMQSAGVTLVRGDLRGIVRARRLSRATMTNIRQNLFFALVYNAVGVPIAAGVLYPFLGLLLSPMIAAAAMTFSSVSVIINSLRLRHAKL